ncbi:Protein of uncharacterised function (DUF499) [[Flavobacterium] thermophilum]|nr:hypothetical protein GARCT_00860 [Geobacillus sp. 12AMOR1]STO11358.1 Protein of uncharacterised function (DUF499) [[Flavobacterium] thermophilum]
MLDNYQLVTKGFQLLTEILAPYVCQQLQAEYRSNWWYEGVIQKLHDVQKRDLPDDGDFSTLVDSLDAARCLILMDIHWGNIFKKKLSRDHLNWIKELIATRNKWAHKGPGDISDEDAWRALDTMARLLEQIDSENTEAIRELARRVRYGTTGASTSVYEEKGSTLNVLSQSPRKGLLPWRFVIEPHPDVAQGRYTQAEFAADLAQVVRGTAEIEYQDPVEFFGRTYITEGMRSLLVQAIRRVSGIGGEPVVQLKTAFGGGKTHTMLALYHLLRKKKGKAAALEKIKEINSILQEAGVDKCPEVNVAVLVGTALNPSKIKRPPNFPGITIRTLWGEMTAQLAEQAGRPELYDIIREADKLSVSPGSETLTELFNECGPCLILIDEIVAYARKIYGVSGLPAGSFESVLSFIQELTEAARASKNCLVIASIPESDIEIGGEAGKLTLEFIEHTFGRMEAIWKPVSAEEGFEIVRRRLFLPVKDVAAQEEVCRAFSEMYREGGQDYPIECKELAYLERLRSCYPIHPEVFDRLYNDWATLERFQKTRGVLRLMATVIHDLWIRQDASLLIMPGSIPFDTVKVREEVTRYLPDGWNTVVENDVDGPRSLPYRIDNDNPRFGQLMAARRVARAIFLGSAPSVREQRIRGIEDVRIRLGVVQPGESVAVFNDALGRLVDKLAHLYVSNQRYWYDLPPNLRRTVEDRSQQITDPEVESEIERRLKSIRERGEFAAVHNCPSSSLDVPDEQQVRLVVLGPKYTHRTNKEASSAIEMALEILMNRGNNPRIYRNMLAFVAPDRELINTLKREVRKFLAWKSVVDDAEGLNLDANQQRQAKENLKRSEETVELRLKEAYCWLLVPISSDIGEIEWEVSQISGGTESHIIKASKRMKSSEQLITKWSAALLRMELDRWLWKNSEYISIKQLWEYLSSYTYLSRLKNIDVLLETIKEGLNFQEFFAYASAVSDDKYLGLVFGDSNKVHSVNHNGFLVKPDVAKEYIEKSKQTQTASILNNSTNQIGRHSHIIEEFEDFVTSNNNPGISATSMEETKPNNTLPRRFYGVVKLDSNRIGRDAGRIAEEIVQHLTVLQNANVEVTLEIQAEIKDGVPEGTIRTIIENCRALKFKDYGFEES